MMEINLFPLVVAILITSQTSFGYTSNDFCIENGLYQDVCEDRLRQVENDYDIHTKLHNFKQITTPKLVSALSRYHSGTENSRIYKERDASKDEHSNDFYDKQYRFNNRLEARRSDNSRIRNSKELNNRLSEQKAARDLSRNRVNVFRHRYANQMGTFLSRSRYAKDVTSRLDSDMPFNRYQTERETRYNYRLLGEILSAENRARHNQLERDFTFEPREMRKIGQEPMDSARTMETRDKIRLINNKRYGVSRVRVEIRDQRRTENGRHMEGLNHDVENRDGTSDDILSRRMYRRGLESINRRFEIRSRMSDNNGHRMVTRRRREASHELLAASTNGHHRDNYANKVESHARKLVDKERRAERTTTENTNSLKATRDQRMEMRDRILSHNARHIKSSEHRLDSRDRIFAENNRRIETRDRNVENRDQMSTVDNIRLMENRYSRLLDNDRPSATRDQMATDHARIIESIEQTGERRDQLLVDNARRIEINVRPLNSRPVTTRGRYGNQRARWSDDSDYRMVSRNRRLDEIRVESHNRMPSDTGRRMVTHRRIVARYNLRYDNDDGRSMENRGGHNNISYRRHIVSKRSAESHEHIFANIEGRMETGISSELVPNIENRDFRLNDIERRTERRDSMEHRIEGRTFTESRRKNQAPSINPEQAVLINDKQMHSLDKYHSQNIMLNAFKTLCMGLLVIQLIDFGRYEKFHKSSFLGIFAVKHPLTKWIK